MPRSLLLHSATAFVATNLLAIVALAAVMFAAAKIALPLLGVIVVGIVAGRLIEPFQRRAVRRAMLREGLCPGCAYDLLSIDPEEGERAICPECGVGWHLPGHPAAGAAAGRTPALA